MVKRRRRDLELEMYRWTTSEVFPDFPDFDVFISLPLVASIFTAELCAIFLALSCISFHGNNNLIYCDFRIAAAGPSLWKYVSFVKFTSIENLSPTLVSLTTKKQMFWPKGPSSYPGPIIMLYSCRTTFPLRRSIRTFWQPHWEQCAADGNKLALLKPFLSV